MAIKFYFQSYKKGQYYSQKSHNYYPSTDIGNQVWLSPTELCHGEQLDLYEIKKRIDPNVDTKERNIIQRFNDTTQFTIKTKKAKLFLMTKKRMINSIMHYMIYYLILFLIISI